MSDDASLEGHVSADAEGAAAESLEEAGDAANTPSRAESSYPSAAEPVLGAYYKGTREAAAEAVYYSPGSSTAAPW